MKNEHEAFLETVLEANPACTVIVERDTRKISYVNDAAARVIGVPREEIVGKVCHHFICPSERHKCPVNDLGQTVDRSERILIRGDGPRVPILKTVVPITINGKSCLLESFIDITERKRAEDALQSKTALLEAQMNATIDGILVVDENRRRILTNHRIIELFDVPLHILENDDDAALLEHVSNMTRYPNEFLEKVAYLYDHVNETSRDEIEFKNGMVLDRYSAPVSGKDGKYYGRIWTFRDITERRRSEEALRESEAGYRQIYENAPAAIYRVDFRTGRIVKANDVLCEYLGVSQEEVTSLHAYDLLTEGSKKLFLERVEKITLGLDVPDTVEYEAIDGHGRPRCIQLHNRMIYDEEGRIVASDVVAHDITERHQAEKALRESEEQYTRLVDAIPDAILRLDLNGKVLFVNNNALQVTGYSREQIEGRNILHFIAREDRDTAIQNRVHIMERKLGPREYRLIMKDGRSVPFEVNGDVLRNEDGTPFGLVYMCRDISERKHAEEALRKSEEMFSKVFRSSPAAIAVTRMRDGLLVDTNEPLRSLLRYDQKDLIGKTTNELNIWANTGDRERLVKRLAQGQSIRDEEVWFRTKDGDVVVSRYSAEVIEVEGEPFILSLLVDITDRMRLEEDRQKLEQQLFQAQKMDSLGTLAGGIAHDFNNILSAIIGYTELALEDVTNPERTRDELEEVLKAGDRAKDLVSQILTFSRKTEAVHLPVELRTVMKESLKMLRSVIPSTIEIRQDLKASGLVMSNPTQINQVIMNLCTNAVHAMGKGGGMLEVSLKGVDLDRETASDLDVVPGAYLKLTVSDTGHGMPPEVMERIFEPYFTTKELGHGTGLGLSVVHGIVKSHGGAIICMSVPDKGTTFEVYLPGIESDKKASGPFKREPLPTGTERILFIDDETALTALAEKMLGRLGYRVTVRNSGVEALDFFRERPHEFDLIITDMTMPGLTGDRTARKIMEIRPDIPVILCSGYSEHMSEEKAKKIGIREFVMKPFEMKELAAAIRRVLDDAGDSPTPDME